MGNQFIKLETRTDDYYEVTSASNRPRLSSRWAEHDYNEIENCIDASMTMFLATIEDWSWSWKFANNMS